MKKYTLSIILSVLIIFSFTVSAYAGEVGDNGQTGIGIHIDVTQPADEQTGNVQTGDAAQTDNDQTSDIAQTDGTQTSDAAQTDDTQVVDLNQTAGNVSAADSTSEKTVFNWADYTETINSNADYAGDFYTIESSALKIYIPYSFHAVELTGEDIDNGYCAFFKNDGNAEIGITCLQMSSDITLDTYYDLISRLYAVKDAKYITVNGLTALSFTDPDNKDESVLVFIDDYSMLTEVTFYPVSDKSFKEAAELIAASLQK